MRNKIFIIKKTDDEVQTFEKIYLFIYLFIKQYSEAEMPHRADTSYIKSFDTIY